MPPPVAGVAAARMAMMLDALALGFIAGFVPFFVIGVILGMLLYWRAGNW